MPKRHRSVLALAIVLLALGGCGRQEGTGQGAPLQPGWTELPAGPHSPGLDTPIVFWAGLS